METLIVFASVAMVLFSACCIVYLFKQAKQGIINLMEYAASDVLDKYYVKKE